MVASKNSRIDEMPLQTDRSEAEMRDGFHPHQAEVHLLLTVEQAARKLNVGRSTLYGLLHSGRLESVTVGRLRRVPAVSLSRFIESLRNGSEP
jgi:excisionase family DNA binding protein